VGKRTHIIGIGSPSGDDQAGWLVIDALADALDNKLPPDVELTKLDRPGSTLIPLFEKADRVILIDAMQADSSPGEIRHFSNDEWASYRAGLSSHGLGVFEALMLARELACLPETLELYGIEIGSALPGDQPSDTVISAAGKLADRIAHDWSALHGRQMSRSNGGKQAGSGDLSEQSEEEAGSRLP
jgi:hydrogenase maturation protease